MSQPSPDRLRAVVERLAGFHTRNTLSPLHRDAADHLAAEYEALGYEAEIMTYILPVGKRVAEPTEAVQVIATKRGRTGSRVITSAHFDTLNLTQDQRTGRAPGANDDASGIAVGLETARLLAGQEWEQTLVFASFSGEEQGLCGARALARRAKAEEWQISAVLNYDMVGNSGNDRGWHEDRQTRCFSDEGSRELARWIEWVSRSEDFHIKLVLRHDRFGRGGDHTPFNQEGFRALRFTEVYEEYARQHTVDDLPEHVDFDLLCGVTNMNLKAVTALASAPAAPADVTKARENGHDTRVAWKGGSGTVLWRETTSAVWQGSVVSGSGEVVVDGVNIDDHEFAVSTGGEPVVATA